MEARGRGEERVSDDLIIRKRAASDWMVMPLVRYADFDGRSRRTEFVGFVIFHTIVMLCAGLSMLLGLAITGELNFFVLIPLIIYLIATFIPRLALGVRRLHDQGRSGWWLLIGFVPYVGPFAELALMLQPGIPGANRYGDDPRALEAPHPARRALNPAPHSARRPSHLIAE